jgi:hypothetical protein
VLCVSTCHEGGGFFVPNRDEPNAVPPSAQGLDERIDPVTDDTEYKGDVPFDEGLNQDIRGSERG